MISFLSVKVQRSDQISDDYMAEIDASLQSQRILSQSDGGVEYKDNSLIFCQMPKLCKILIMSLKYPLQLN